MVEQAEITDLANIAEAALKAVSKPPDPLPPGWILKASRSQPNYYYYYNLSTGVSSWQPPVVEEERRPPAVEATSVSKTSQSKKRPVEHVSPSTKPVAASASIGNNTDTTKEPPSKRPRPTKVRTLHILKKHKLSKRPSSWRKKEITISKAEAIDELQSLLELLQEVQHDPKELRATFEELARTESDCNSAKRGGDLGFFGPKKMQPAFETASFDLDIGQLSGIVETSSGVHIILRLG